MTIQETIAAKQRLMTPQRLARGAEVLGRLWREGVRCLGQWSKVCPCPEKNDFCTSKIKWLDLLLEFGGGKLPYDLSGTEGFLVLECMDARMFEASGLTILLALPGCRAPLRIGRKGTCGQTILDLVAIPDGPDRVDAIEAVVKIQEVAGAGSQ